MFAKSSRYGTDKFNPEIVPLRLADNIRSGYAKFIDWTNNSEHIRKRIDDAFENRIDKCDKIDNSREQYKYNRSD
jgi:hypothetical protein